MTSSRSALLSHTRLGDLHSTLTTEVASGKGVGLDGTRPDTFRNAAKSFSREMCGLVQARMRNGSYRFTPYREVLVSKGRDRLPRVISIPTVRDRLALKVLSQVLHDLYGISGPEIAQRLVGRLNSQCGRWSGFVRVDLEDYFGSINQELLMDQVRRASPSRAVQRLISRAIQNPTVPAGVRRVAQPALNGIPQGLSISSALAEIFLSDFDKEWRESPSVCYFRYVDDVVVLCDLEKAPEIFEVIASQLSARLLKPHPLSPDSKSSVGDMSSGFDFLGYHFANSGTSISSRAMRKIENRIAATFGEYRRMSRAGVPGALSWLNWKISRLACGVIFQGEHRGWLRFYSRTNDVSGLHHLDALVAKLSERSGVPKGLRFKRFVRAYHVTRSGHAFTHYIPNPANWSPDAARQHLIDVDGWEAARVAALHPHELYRAVERVLARDLADLERDLDTQS